MGPFDLKSAILAKHAQHVVLIHFPIALFIAGVGFDVAAQWTKKTSLAAASYYNVTLAALFSLPVIATGILAWQWQMEGERLQGTLLLHLAFGVASAILIWIVWWIHLRAKRNPARSLFVYRCALELLAVLAIAFAAHLGGFLTGVNSAG